MLHKFVSQKTNLHTITTAHWKHPWGGKIEDHPKNTNLISLKSAKNVRDRHNMSILSLNIQSLNANYDHLCTLIDSINNPEIISLSESFHPRPQNSTIKNYHKFIHTTRTNSRGGGCGLFIRNDLDIQKDFSLKNAPKTTTFEYSYALTITKIKHRKFKNLFVSIYKPPKTKIKEFIPEFKNLLEALNATNTKTTICGDLNINVSTKNKSTTDFCSLIHEYNLIQYVQSFTHYSKTTQTLIDHVMSNEICTSYVLNTQIAVGVGIHLPILTIFNNSEKKRIIKPYKYNYINLIDRNTDKIIEKLAQKDWDKWIKDSSSLNSNETFNSFHSIITNTVNECTSNDKVKSKLKLRPKTPWITEKSLLTKQKANKLHKKYIRNQSLITYNELLDTIKEYKKSIKKDKKSYYLQRLTDANSNSKEIWKVIDELLNRDKKPRINIKTIRKNDNLITNPGEIANEFNHYYKNVAVDLAKKIPQASHPSEHYMTYTPKPKTEFILKEITEGDILREIRSFKSKLSSGYDNLPNRLIKSIAHTILKPLKYTINKSYREGEFPEILKTSKITPIFKKQDPTLMQFYRPIHQLSGFSKLYEKLTMYQAKQFHKKENIIPNHQFAFQEKHSTYHALLMTKNKIKCELNANNYCILCSLDLSKCFDTLDIETVLPMKMAHYYQNTNTIKYLQSFFTKRKQFVSIGKVTSETIENYDISCVQGSTTGPIIFSVYSADMTNITHEFIINFADDTNVVVFGSEFKKVQAAANEVLSILQDYMKANKLTLNVEKTVSILFTPPTKKSVKLDLYIGNNKLEQVSETKFLGITIDEKLKFTTHMNNVTRKAKTGLNALIQVKNILPYQAKLKIYYGLIHSHINYCPLIWLLDQPLKNHKILEKIQKKAVRILFNAKPNSHTENMFTISNITKIRNLCLNDQLNIMYQHQFNYLPKAISNIIIEAASHLRPERKKARFINIKTYDNTGNIAYDMINNWNKWPDEMTKTKKYSPITVKKRIKKYLQSKSLYLCNKSECHSCNLTPTIDKLIAYTHYS